MYTLKAAYRVVTPLFAGGADQQSSAELRAPAFKGVLRFWYRAVALPFCKGDWHEVRKQEKELFGSTDGQASFMLKVEAEHEPEMVPPEQEWTGLGSAYLGYGLIKPGRTGITTRPYIKEGFRFTATLVMSRKKAESADTGGLKRALKALGLFGGLGSRSRKGFGSLALESLDEDGKKVWAAPGDIEDLKTKIQELFQDMSLEDVEPEYSAFSGRSRVTVWPSNSGALELLDEVGREMVRYRSYGQSRGGRRVVLGNEKSEQIFQDDHDLIWDIVQGNNRPTPHPRRVAFGLPHKYFFFSARQKVDVNAKDCQRRAGPLFIHIHQLTGGCAAVFTLLPARFLPNEDRVKISVPGGNTVTVEPQVDYQVIHDFIDRFDGREEVLP